MDFTIKGFRFAVTAAGIKKEGAQRTDFAYIQSDTPCVTAGVTTTNLVYAAPVEITRATLRKGLCQGVLINSGNANSYTGARGRKDALYLIDRAAQLAGVPPELIIPMSTGVIGNPLPVARMETKLPELVRRLGSDSLEQVAKAIMTTDTKPKITAATGEVSTGPVKMVGIAKGAGMIAPGMATLLSVILTDVKPRLNILREIMAQACEKTFNRITIDGDTSTNDTAIIMAGGSRESRVLGDSSSDVEIFSGMLHKICGKLALELVKDGEGATKMVRIKVIGAPDADSAVIMARKIAESPLVKTAFHGEDPNWGRIVCAAGNSGVPFDPSKLNLWIDNVAIIKNGELASADWEKEAHERMKNSEFAVKIDLNAGSGEAEYLTTDFSEEYVAINADYRS